MKFLNHIFNKHRPVALSILGILAFVVIMRVFAATPYAPGTSLDPAEGPGDAFVSIPTADWTTVGNDMHNTNSGNVGIGTSSPSEKLEVAGNIKMNTLTSSFINWRVGDSLLNGVEGAPGTLTVQGVNGLDIQTYNGPLTITQSTANASGYIAFKSGSTEAMRIDSVGNVGIGTASPGSALEIHGTYSTSLNPAGIHLKGNIPGISFEDDGGGASERNFTLINNYNAAGAFELLYSSTPTGEPGSTAIYVDGTDGFIGLGSTRGLSTTNRLGINGSVQIGGGFYNDNAPSNGLIVEGNVGIGTATPATLLDVPGTVTIGASNFDTTTGVFDGANRQIKFTPGGLIFADFSAWLLLGTEQQVSIDVNSRLLKSTSGTTVANWSTGFFQINGALSPDVNFSAGAVASSDNLRIAANPDGTAGTFVSLTAFNGGSWRTGLKYTQVASGEPDLLLVPDGFGNVGIGTVSPSEKLHISGNVRFSGALMPNNLAGTSGQILTSAGAGSPPTWETQSIYPIITAGTYTPILTNGINVTSSVASPCSYYIAQVDAENYHVTISGVFTVDPSATATLTELQISTPPALAGSAVQAGGGVASAPLFTDPASIEGGGDLLKVLWTPVDASNKDYRFTFSGLFSIIP